MQKKEFPQPSRSNDDWNKIFKAPKPIQHLVFECGQAGIMKSMMLNLKDPRAKKIKNEHMRAPIYAHAIRHKKFGDYLIDTGLDQSYLTNPYGRMKGLLLKLLIEKFILKSGQDILSQVKKHQLSLKGVFFTHLHHDHTAGIPDLPSSLAYVAPKNDTLINSKWVFYGNHLLGIDVLQEIDFTTAGVLPPLGPSVDIFGDGSFWAISTPGHSKNHTSYLVNSTDGPLFVLGDACPTKQGWETGIGPGFISANVAQGQKSLDQLKGFIEKYPQIKFICGHELI